MIVNSLLFKTFRTATFSGTRIIARNMSGIVENTIRNKLQTSLGTKHLEIINESYMHNVPKGAETHFKVVVVSDKFDGLPLIKRHRLVNEILKEELQTGVHALSIVAKTPEQWDNSDKVVESSPNCRGGFGK
ncbi:bolA-like protein DDB_G0274169 [Leguminivora glycinivorella]|uniref:bolA-like protein DDB_G0274169 n=1 Tax=Leguminivora glycinivorella TaxID=1035111 RepID=UPI00200FDE23|nr:bolA-like protein DDB_G0274169 [Leguminivora glycinivorella]XP_048006873.1 bolA-like protein DDB_G0274169 [Leguminivora glycinivorella]